jgi:methyl-accepting chemotaxis protein
MATNMKVSTRLGLGFAAVIALLGAVIGIGVWGMLRSEAELARVRDQGEQIVLQGAMLDVIQYSVILAGEIFTSDDPEIVKKINALSEGNKARANSTVKELTTLIKTDDERRTFARVEEKRQNVTPMRVKIMKTFKEGGRDQARKLFESEYLPVVMDYRNALLEWTEKERAALKAVSVQALEHNRSAFRLLVAGVLAAIVLAIATAVYVTRSLTRPLGGEPGYAVEIANHIARGELNVAVDVAAADRSSLLYALKKMKDELAESVTAIQAAADNVSVGSREIARGNADLSSRTEEQASSLEETASSMEELTTTVKLNADNARQANQLAIGSSDVATRGGKAVQNVVATMRGISEASSKIADIINVIDGIAFQTNILALNAAVEAARAGEQGRGFAVVAAEVRSLAQRSAGAAKEIKALIEDSARRVAEGSKQVDDAGKTMGEIVASVKQVTDIMSEIAAASQEQLAGIEQVSRAVAQMDQVVQQNAALVEESAAAAENMSGQADQLTQTVARFKIDGASGGGRAEPPAMDELTGGAAAQLARPKPIGGGASSTMRLIRRS